MREGGLLGWSTNALVKFDDGVPGVIARALTAAPARRQAIFAAVAAREVEGGLTFNKDDLFPADFAEILRHGRGSDILRHAYGDVPRGFPGVLERIGERPLERPEDYIALRDIMATGDERATGALMSCGRITRAKMRVLANLDVRWVHANTLSRIETSFEAQSFNDAIGFVQSVCSRASDEAIAEAIGRMTPTATLPKLLQRWVRRADRLPPNPIGVGDNELRPLTTINDYLEVGRKYRNCLSTKIEEVVAGRIAIAEFRGEVLLEFRPMSADKGWALWASHARRNEPVDDVIAEAGALKCEELGIPRPDQRAGGSGWRSYRRFTRQPDWSWAA